MYNCWTFTLQLPNFCLEKLLKSFQCGFLFNVMNLAKQQLRSKYGSEIDKNLLIPFVRLSLQFSHLTFQHRLTFSILVFKISLCAEPHLEPSQTSTRLIIWSFLFRAEFLRGTLHVQFHPGVNFTPGLSSPLSLVKLYFLFTCSTEVKSRPYPYFTLDRAKFTPGVIRHDFNV